jgi:hypothetical protein
MISKKDYGVKVFLFTLGCALYWLFRIKIQHAGSYTITKPLVEISVVVLIYSLGQLTIWISRYSMSHVACNGFSGSILGKPVILKDNNQTFWCVFNTGEFLEPFHGAGKIATLIIPLNQLNEAGKNYVSRTFVKKSTFHRIPPVVYNFLIRNPDNYNTEEIYFGFYSEEFLHENPNLASLEQEITNLYDQLNLRQDLLEGRNDAFEEQMEFAKKMSGNKRSILDVFGRNPKADTDPNNKSS